MLEPCIETLEMVLNFDWIMAIENDIIIILILM
jgi:hypothetical protein